MKAKMINSKSLALFVAISLTFLSWGVASAAYHFYGDPVNCPSAPAVECTNCHDMHGGTGNLSLIVEQIPGYPGGWCDQGPLATVEFTIVPDHYADGSGSRICEVCHTRTNYYRNDGSSPNGDHHVGEDCMTCHSHCDEFLHGGGTGAGCEPCHGHSAGYEYDPVNHPGELSVGGGTAQSHATHTENNGVAVKGPFEDCGTCHNTNNYPIFKDDEPLETTTACDPCHSPGGAFNGTSMAKANWNVGGMGGDKYQSNIYEADGVTLKAGKEQWCATCHDDEPAYSAPNPPSEPAGEIVLGNPDSTVGSWVLFSGGYGGDAYYNQVPGNINDTATWTPDIPQAGDYNVYAQWIASPNRATDAPYTITYDSGSETVDVNQQINGGQWKLLGTYTFAAGTSGSIVLTGDANGYVIADAVMLVPYDPSTIILDSPEAVIAGEWVAASGGYGGGIYYTDTPGDINDTATWTPDIPQAGDYNVYAQWVAGSNRATDAPYTITYDSGSVTVDVNQQINGGVWNLIGTYTFAAGTSGSIELSGDANGFVIADAVMLQSTNIQLDAGAYAPNVIGDNTTYGFYVTGHNIACLSCHDASKAHIDNEPRTYASASNNYQAGYRLRSVDGKLPMVLPRPSRKGGNPHDWWTDFALCFDCHNRNEVLGNAKTDYSHTNFWSTNGRQPDINFHWYHLSMARKDFNSDWDGPGDSDYSCVACHNVHGSTTPAMVRHGELVDKVPALNLCYVTSASDPDCAPGATVGQSIAGACNWKGPKLTQNGVCAGKCHATLRHNRTGNPIAKVIDAKSEPATAPVGQATDVLLTAVVQDHDSDVTGVTVDTTEIGGIGLESMTDPDLDGIWSLQTTVPALVGAGTKTLPVVATDGEGTATNEIVLEVSDPTVVIMDDHEAVYDDEATWTYYSNAAAYEGTARFHVAGTGLNTATWTPDMPQADYYQVYAWWHASANRATNAPYEINYDGGYRTVNVDQQIAGSQWNDLGIYLFAAGTSDSVVLSDDADGYVIADAVKLEVVDPDDVIMDNTGAVFTGTWTPYSHAEPYAGTEHYAAAGVGGSTATWGAPPILNGNYRVYAWWHASANRATDAPYTINYNGGPITVDMNQQINGGKWNELTELSGPLPFTTGESVSVVLTNDANGYVIADAVRFELVP